MKNNWGSLQPTYVNSFGAHLFFLANFKSILETLFFPQSKRKYFHPLSPATCHKKCLCLCHIAGSIAGIRRRNAKLVLACIDSCRYLTGGIPCLPPAFSSAFLPPLTPHLLPTHTLLFLLLLLLCQGQRTAGAHLRFSALRWA